MKFCYYWYQDVYKPAQIKKINKFILANPNPKLQDKPSDKAVKTAKVSVLDLKTLINLSEKEYEGGDLYIWWGEPLHVKEFSKPGSVLVFPSFMAHKVTPVTKGERITLAIWKKGPWWQ